MEYKVTVEGNQIIVTVETVNIRAEFDTMDQATEFIQAVITNITSF